MRFKPIAYKLHRWAGLGLGAWALAVGLSGSVLAFRAPLDAALHPRQILAPISASAENIDLAFRSVSARYPDRQIVGFARAGDRADESLQVRMTEAQTLGHSIDIQDKRFDPDRDAHLLVFVNPRTGEILGDRPYWDLMQLTFWFHTELLGPLVGRGYLGIIGFALLFLGITGLIYWWPRAGRWAASFRVATDRGRNRFLRDLHSASGAFVAIALILSSLTGVFMCYEAQIMSVFRAWGFARATSQPSPTRATPSRPMIPVGDAVRIAQHAFSGYYPSFVGLPIAGRDRYQIQLTPLHDSRIWWTVETTIDAYTGELLGAFDPHTQPAGNSMVLWVIFLHNGQMFGWPGRLLVLAEGLALVGLCVTGPWLWLIRRRARNSGQPRVKAQPSMARRGEKQRASVSV